MSCEGPKIARRLSREGWTVTATAEDGYQYWQASHPDAGHTVSWGPNAIVQRVLGEAADALGKPRPGVRTSDRERPPAEARQRAKAVAAERRRAAQLDRIRSENYRSDVARRRLMADEDRQRFYSKLMQRGR